MKTLIAALIMSLVSTAACSDELADGIKSWESRDFIHAQQIFSKLANAGNPEAQLLLGEMYGYGEGVPEDPAQAARWLDQARVNGHRDAAQSLENVRQRGLRKADIARYVNGADGAVPTLASAGCVTPVLPEQSRSQVEIKAIDASIKQWRACYERFGSQLSAQSAAREIPPELAKLMSLVELERARAAIDRAYAAAGAEALAFAKASDAWYANTKQYTIGMAKAAGDESARRQRELDDVQQRAYAVAQQRRK